SKSKRGDRRRNRSPCTGRECPEHRAKPELSARWMTVPIRTHSARPESKSTPLLGSPALEARRAAAARDAPTGARSSLTGSASTARPPRARRLPPASSCRPVQHNPIAHEQSFGRHTESSQRCLAETQARRGPEFGLAFQTLRE